MRTVKVSDAIRQGGTPLDLFRRFPIHVQRKEVPERVLLHTHDHFEVDFVVGGHCQNHHPSGTHGVGPGEIMLGNTFEAHEIRHGGHLEIISLKFSPDALPEGQVVSLLHPFLTASPVLRGRLKPGVFVGDAIGSLMALLAGKENFPESLTRQIFLTVLGLLSSQVPPRGAGVTENGLRLALRGATWLESRVSQTLSISSMAHTMEVGSSTLVAAFQKTFGSPPKAYHLARRISHAQVLMAREGASVTAAAAGAGWNDLSAFYRAFRKQTGEAPQAWRRRMVGGLEK